MDREFFDYSASMAAGLRRAVTGVFLTLACICLVGCDDANKTGPGGNGGSGGNLYEYDDNGQPGSDWFENEYDGDDRWNPPPPQGPYSP